MFNFNHFYYFYLTAETGSITAASRILKISQPALSKQIIHFENSINTKLFKRVGRKLKLTPSGLSLFGHGRVVFKNAEWINRNFTLNRFVEREQVRLVVSKGIGRPLVSEFVVKFFSLYGKKETRPSLIVNTLEGDYVSSFLQERVVDACLTERRIANHSLFAVASVHVPLCLVIPSSFMKLLSTHIKKRNLKEIITTLQLPWILPTSDIRLRYYIEELADVHSLGFESILESDSIMTIVKAVKQGLGISLLPKYYLSYEKPDKDISVVEDLKSMPKISLFLWARRADKNHTSIRNLAKAFGSVYKE